MKKEILTAGAAVVAICMAFGVASWLLRLTLKVLGKGIALLLTNTPFLLACIVIALLIYKRKKEKASSKD